MHLVQILLPLRDNGGRDFPPELYGGVRAALKGRFGGMTAYSRAPAEGLWEDDGTTVHDDIMVLEVMAEELDPAWWGNYRRELEKAFKQDTVVVRAQHVTLL